MAEFYSIAEILNDVLVTGTTSTLSTFNSSADVLNAIYSPGDSALRISVSGSTSGSVWGTITGDINNQTDLADALGGKASAAEFNTYVNTTAPATYLSITNFDTYSGTTDSSIADLDSDKSDKNITITLKSASYEVDADDNGTMIRFSDDATVTLPDGMDNGYQVVIENSGSSKTITLSATTTLQSKATTITTQYGGATCTHVGSNVWLAMGDLV